MSKISKAREEAIRDIVNLENALRDPSVSSGGLTCTWKVEHVLGKLKEKLREILRERKRPKARNPEVWSKNESS